MKLVIVESPKKARTIAGLLGKGYRVAASMGHVRDLPPKALGIDVGRDFAPAYELLPKAQRPLADLRQAVRGAEDVLLATDPDREGEAIAWHLVEALRLPPGRYRRITFHEISQRAIQAALAHPRDLDADLIDAQQARRVLDRLVGYGLSPLLWRKVQRGTSAGRVQSVALRMVVDREREIAAFVPQEYWTIDVRLRPALSGGHSPNEGAGDAFLARLVTVDGQKATIGDGGSARLLEGQLRDADYHVRQTGSETLTRQAPPPFTTSTLQQTAGNRLRLPARKTMTLAQALYEAGLITYMRTDSVAVSAPAVAEARRLIAAQFGPAYVPGSPRRYRTKTKNAQEAHEAIRPVDMARTPATTRASLPADEWRLYDLIWKRMVASQMAPARYVRDVALVDATYSPTVTGTDRRFTLKAQATALSFPGWLAVYGADVAAESVAAESVAPGATGPERSGSKSMGPEPKPEIEESASEAAANSHLPPLTAGQPLHLEDVLPGQHFTRPPSRYTEAALVKAMEEAGVGRPSTYATVVSTIQERGYVSLTQRQLLPTELGCAASDFLVGHFPRIVDLPFTAELENSLDEIAGGRLRWTAMLQDFYTPFSETVARAKGAAVSDVKRLEPPPGTVPRAKAAPRAKAGRGRAEAAEAGEALPRPRAGPAPVKGAAPAGTTPCPQCGRALVARVSQFGPFLGCSGYPECRYVHRSPGSLGRPTSTRPASSGKPGRPVALSGAATAPPTAPTGPRPPRRRAGAGTRGRRESVHRQAGAPQGALPSPMTARVVPAGARRRASGAGPQVSAEPSL